jgi:hypothetical protein
MSPAFVVSIVALVAAVAGGAYAAGVAKNSVTSKAIRNGAVKGIDVKDHSLTAGDIDASALPARGATGPAGAKGATGPTGVAGPTASTFASRIGTGSVGFTGPDFFRLVELDSTSPTYPGGQTTLGPLSVSFPARINLYATVVPRNAGTTGEDAEVECRLELFPAGPGAAEVGRPAKTEIEGSASRTETAGDLTLIATVDRPAGTYDADVVCRDNSNTGMVRASEASLQAVATAR